MSEMFYGASPEIFARARSLRQNTTEFESKIWELLKNKYQDYKFRRQHPMGPYIADFYCHKLKLVIELDGSHHYYNDVQKSSDEMRDSDMRKWGITVLRYPNHIKSERIFNDIDNIISQTHPHQTCRFASLTLKGTTALSNTNLRVRLPLEDGVSESFPPTP